MDCPEPQKTGVRTGGGRMVDLPLVVALEALEWVGRWSSRPWNVPSTWKTPNTVEIAEYFGELLSHKF